eukprot:CAMPEP_0115071070 /NCGR_PEP_ID=MMETSP0227-20121206/13465_1 /TAXON_ID=89957 /ORGANISM="Polarella glacialis, Strain CCMP 1383" /LENGTH=201 /DNA_ID=CAMNT_0002457655 /DNA_START=92 /DNA_END=694 /DNA_ORIENTATION=-
MSRMARAHLFDGVGPIKFHKIRIRKADASPVIYGWHHNTPWSKFNNFAWYWSENKMIRKTIVNHAMKVRQTREFGNQLDASPSVTQELSQDGPFTLFCPNNDAMEMIRESAWEKLWDEEKARFLRNHVVRGKWGIADLAAAHGSKEVKSLAEQGLEVTVTGSLETMDRVVQIGGATVTKANIRCWNGYVHIIDRPLVPRFR